MSALMGIVLAIAAAILPTCASEDATNCVWNASEQGNGAGSSFVDIGGRAYPIELQGVVR